MNHNADAFYAISIAAAAAAVAVTLVSPANAHAESIGACTTTFAGTLSRADVAEPVASRVQAGRIPGGPAR